jgi:hypothetical protein
MGRIRTSNSYAQKLNRQSQAFFSSIHRARVTDVHVDAGTVNALIENTDLNVTVLSPLVSLSLPPKQSDTDDNGRNAAWGRYIPQEGDMVLIGFDTNGDPYCLGYHAVYYGALSVKDSERESKGGIGWGESSNIRIKPGDWDFKSRRNSRLMLTDKAILSSVPQSLVLNKSDGDTTLTSDLSIVKYGSASEHRQGSVRRTILPTDSSETYIYGMFGSVAQESTDRVSRGMIGLPAGIEMARTSMGEVIDELTFLPMVPALSYPTLSQLSGTGTRLFRNVKDPLGVTDSYSELVDDLGNYGVVAPTAIAFQWMAPLATWTINNIQTSITSAATFDITTIDFSVTSATSTITAAQLSLGASSATDFLIKGTTFIGDLNVFLTSCLTAFASLSAASVGPLAGLQGGFGQLIQAATALQLQLASTLSTVVKTV